VVGFTIIPVAVVVVEMLLAVLVVSVGAVPVPLVLMRQLSGQSTLVVVVAVLKMATVPTVAPV
jgi:hypothetical protein